MENKSYIAIDLKSFFASVECVERGLDPLKTNLVVADSNRTEKTICLAVSPSLKKYGLSGRARLFEVVQKVAEANKKRELFSKEYKFIGKSFDEEELKDNPELAIDYIVATPRMNLYSTYSKSVYDIYLKYFAPSDILNYSIDEVFLDATPYLKAMKMTAKEYSKLILNEVYNKTGITATVGIGTNMYLSKVAMDIVAKHLEADSEGVRIAELDEISYRNKLWAHRPLTDFWRIGKGISKKLEENGIYTMGDIAKCSIGSPKSFYNEGLLYKLFGVNAELIIDHAWGYEPCTIKDAKGYTPKNNSICSGQVLHTPYNFSKAKIIVREMIELLVLDIVQKGLVTSQIVLTVGYDIENLINEQIKNNYKGEIVLDSYGRLIPKHAHGTINFDRHISSTVKITKEVMSLFERITDKNLLVRRINISANKLLTEEQASGEKRFIQLDMFSNNNVNENNGLGKERDIQRTVIEIKSKYGKNSILRGVNFEDGATTRDRNGQMGGHKA